MMRKSPIQAIVFSLFACTIIGLSGCGSKNASSSDAATQADIDALSQIVGKQLKTTQPSPTESSRFSAKAKGKFSNSEEHLVDTIANGTELSFLNTTLTVQDNKITYNNHDYTYEFGFSDGSNENYYSFSRTVSPEEDIPQIEAVTIDQTSTYTSHFLQQSTYQVSDGRVSINVIINGKVLYGNPSTPYAQIDITNAHILITSINNSDSNSDNFTFTMPFSITIQDLTYTGKFTGTQHETNGEPDEENPGEDITSTLTRDGKEVGIIKLSNDGNSTIRVFLKNSSGTLEEIAASN